MVTVIIDSLSARKTSGEIGWIRTNGQPVNNRPLSL